MPNFFKECPHCHENIVQSPACNKTFFCFLCKVSLVAMDERCTQCDSRIECLTKHPIKNPIYIGR